MLFREDQVARADAEAIRKGVGFYRWTHDLVEITGKDALEVLQKIYISDISKVAVGRSKYTASLDENGEIIDDVIVMHMADGLYWVSDLYGPRLLPWIEQHKGEADIHAKIITYDWDMYAVQGPDSLKAMNAMLDAPVDDLKRFGICERKLGDIPVYIHRSGFTGENGYEIYSAFDKSAEVHDLALKAVESVGGRELQTLEVYVRSIPVEEEEQPQEQQVPAVDAVQVEAVQELPEIPAPHRGKTAEESTPWWRGSAARRGRAASRSCRGAHPAGRRRGRPLRGRPGRGVLLRDAGVGPLVIADVSVIQGHLPPGPGGTASPAAGALPAAGLSARWPAAPASDRAAGRRAGPPPDCSGLRPIPGPEAGAEPAWRGPARREGTPGPADRFPAGTERRPESRRFPEKVRGRGCLPLAAVPGEAEPARCPPVPPGIGPAP